MYGKRSALWALLIVIAVALSGCTSGSDEGLDPDGSGEEEQRERGTDTSESNQVPKRPQDLQETTMSLDYTGFSLTANGLNTGCADYVPGGIGPENVGGVCFEIPEGSVQANVSVVDDNGADVTLYWRMLEGGEAGSVANGDVCERLGELEIPHGATELLFVVQDPVGAQLGCGVTGSVPTEGTVTVTFLHPA